MQNPCLGTVTVLSFSSREDKIPSYKAFARNPSCNFVVSMAVVQPWFVDNFHKYCDGTVGVIRANKVRFIKIIQDQTIVVFTELGV